MDRCYRVFGLAYGPQHARETTLQCGDGHGAISVACLHVERRVSCSAMSLRFVLQAHQGE